MGDTMRDGFEAFHGRRKSKGVAKRESMFARLPDDSYVDDSVQRHWWTWQNAVEAGRQLGMEQSRREPERHEVDILLQQLNDAAMAVDSDQFGLPGDDVPWGELRHIVVSWFANNTAPTQQAGDSDTQS